LVRGLMGLLEPMRGNISRQPVRIGYLPQHRAMELHWPMSGLDAAMLAISARVPFGRVSRPNHRLNAILHMLEVDDLSARAFAKLSGGQQQRLLLAGALAADPQLLVLDEPTDGLDVRSRSVLLRVLAEQTRAGLASVIISHDVEDLLAVADRVAWLHPAENPDAPSRVEDIDPSTLAARLTAVSHIA
jgi:ABC-type Mn2+/Zn2+ transport system ATPase subunit